MSLNTPLIPSLAPFSQCVEPLYLHPATTQILDDMRFLIGLVLALPEDPSDKELQKVQNTSVWIHDRITNLPPKAPAPNQQQHRGSEGLLSPQSNNPSDSSSGARRASSGGDHWQPADASRPVGPEGLHTRSLPSPSPSHPGTPPASCNSSTQDLTYQAVRGAALIYARAIARRRPLRDTAAGGVRDGHGDGDGEDLVLRVWTTIWRVPLRAWRAVLGVFVWVVLSLAPASRGTAHERLAKSLLAVGLTQMGMEDWEVAEAGVQGALKLVAWLGGGKGGRGGGGGGVEIDRRDKERANLGAVIDPALFLGRST